jgi:hypothetical protein
MVLFWRRQRSPQYFTSCQFFSHFLRQVMLRPQTSQFFGSGDGGIKLPSEMEKPEPL